MTEYHCKYDELVDPNILVNHPKNANKHPNVEDLEGVAVAGAVGDKQNQTLGG